MYINFRHNFTLLSECKNFNKDDSSSHQERSQERCSSGRGGELTNKIIHSLKGNIKELRVFAQNIVGTLNAGTKQIEIESILKKYCCDVLFISEASAKEVVGMRISGYDCHAGHLEGHTNVRISAVVRSTLKVTISNVKAEVPNIVVDVDNEGHLYRLTGCYREWSFGGEFRLRDDKSQEARWFQFVDLWREQNRRVKRSILCGDINVDYDRVDTRHQVTLEPLRQSLREDIVEQGWLQLVRAPTRYQNKSPPSLLDHMYCNIPDRVAYVINKSATGGDHNLIGVVLKTRKHVERHKEILTRNYRKIDWGRMRELARYGGLYEVFQYKDPNDIWDFLEFKILTWLDSEAPQRWLKLRPGAAKWRTKELDDACKERSKLHKIWRRDRTDENRKNLNVQKKAVRKLEHRDMWNHANEGLQDPDLHRCWETIKEITGMTSTSGPPTSLLEDGVEITDPRDIANVSNEGFRKKVDNIVAGLNIDLEEAMSTLEEHLGGKIFKDKFQFREVDVWEVREAIGSLRNTTAVGTDGIRTEVLKQLKVEIAPYYAYLVNQILRTKIYPRRFGQGVITPIHKSGPRNIKTNYRPVTILNSASKVFERLINNQIVRYIEDEHVLSDDQHAYRQARGTNTYWLDLISKITDMRQRGLKVGIVCFDLSAAFNVINPKILLAKLSRVGFHEDSIVMLRNFLKKRMVYTKIDGELSEPAEVNIGCPEGGITSPQLFSLAVQDFPVVAPRVERTMKEKIGMITGNLVHSTLAGHKCEVETEAYADDSLLIIGVASGPQWCVMMQESINVGYGTVAKYFGSNGLKLNPSKTELLIIGKGPNDPTFTIEEAGIEEQRVIKLMGLRMDNTMSFMPQALAVTKQVQNRLFNLRKLRQWASRDLVKRTAQSMLLSKLYYLLEVAGGEHKVLDRLQKSQNAVMRTVLGGTMMSNTGTMLKDLEWLNVENQTRLQTAYWVRRTHLEGVAPFFQDMFSCNINNYYTRRKGLVMAYIPKTKVLERQVNFRGVALYNKLNLSQAPTDDMADFKTLVAGRLLYTFHNHGVAGLYKGRQ